MLPVLLLAAGCRQTKPPAAGQAHEQAILLQNVGFATPESVLHDPLSDVYYVSNINGPPTATDDNGFISVVSTRGKLLGLKAIDGASPKVTLNAPKGMALTGNFLYVADINTIRRFDRQTLEPRGEVVIPGATFLNDVAADGAGSVYCTDSGLQQGPNGLVPSGTDAVYRLSPAGKLDTLARGEELGRPNGIAVSENGDSVWVVGFGSGELYRLANGHKTAVVKLPKGNLDGLVLLHGDAIVSSWDGQALYRGHLGGSFEEILGHVEAPADIGLDGWRYRLLIPLFNKNEVWIVSLLP
jgi:DNA-binding beta-propeller fold protein YncE